VSLRHLEIRELSAWGFDPQTDRGSLSCEHLQEAACKAQHRLGVRKPHQAESPISVDQTRSLASALTARREAIAATGEFDGLAWELAIVDLRKLIAFQRRVGFADGDQSPIKQPATCQQLLDLALPTIPSHPSCGISTTPDGTTLTLRTLSPNLSIRFNRVVDDSLGSVGLLAYSGSPYIEVASYHGRWFLRDGYHRSFLLLKHGICHVSAVVVYAETFAQVGSVGNQFFAKEILFSERPPMVTDFLDEEIAIRYLRPQRERVLQVSIRELQEPVQASFHQQERL